MQKLSITALCLLLGGSLFAQVNKGSILIGGSIGYFTTQLENAEGNNIGDQKNLVFYPSIGTALKQNLVLGVDLSYSKREEDNSQQTVLKSEYAGGGIFIRNYQPLGNTFSLFAQGRIGYANIQRTYNDVVYPPYGYAEEGYHISMSVMPGITYKAGKKLFLEMALSDLLNVHYEKLERNSAGPVVGSSQATEIKSFGISSSAGTVQLNVGMRFLFNQ